MDVTEPTAGATAAPSGAPAPADVSPEAQAWTLLYCKHGTYSPTGFTCGGSCPECKRESEPAWPVRVWRWCFGGYCTWVLAYPAMALLLILALLVVAGAVVLVVRLVGWLIDLLLLFT